MFVVVGVSLVVPGEDVFSQNITKFENGYLTFTNENSALYYRVEFKPNLNDPANWDGAYKGMRNIQSPNPEVTVPVGVFYRVVGSDVPFVGGTASAAEILSGKTAYVNDEEVTGTMTNVGKQDVTPGTSPHAIAHGYHDGTGTVAGDADLLAANIVSGKTIFTVAGSALEAAGDAVAADVLVGKTFSRDGAASVAGLMPDRGSPTWTPSTSDQTLDVGYYSGGTVVGDLALVPGNIRGGVAIFGVAGKTKVLDTEGATATDGDILSGKTAYADGALRTGTIETKTLAGTTTVVQAGYYAATNLVEVAAGLVAENIRAGSAIFGIGGTYWGASVPKTGQTNTYHPNDDGASQMGVPWPNPRFTVQADTNCVLDNLTGLMWARNANVFGQMNWTSALENCSGLDYGGHTDWRLPTVREMQSLIDYGRSNSALPPGHPFTGVVNSSYWSSTTDNNVKAQAWVVWVNVGYVQPGNKVNPGYVWPVRGGP